MATELKKVRRLIDTAQSEDVPNRLRHHPQLVTSRPIRLLDRCAFTFPLFDELRGRSYRCGSAVADRAPI